MMAAFVLAGLPAVAGAACPTGFKGPDCGALDLCASGSARSIRSIPGAHVSNTTINTVWGGHSAQDGNGTWHWFGSVIMDGKSLGSWSDASAAGHATTASSPTSEGRPTYSAQPLHEIVLKPSGGDEWDGGSIHGVYLIKNPKPWSNGTDSWLLFYTGFPKVQPLAHRQIGVAHAASLAGPWIKFWGNPVLSPNANTSAVDSSSVSNPAPAFANDGSFRILLAYKGLGRARPSKPPCTDGSGKACISVAEAAHWTAPFEHVTANRGMILLGEDPTLWQAPSSNGGLWHLVYEHYVGTGSQRRSGAHAWSRSGGLEENWIVAPSNSWVGLETALDGKTVLLAKRERYQVTLGAGGQPSLLFNGACLAGGSCFNIFTPFNA